MSPALQPIAQRLRDHGPALPAILSVADRFDGLDRGAQHRLRRLVVRHRGLTGAM